MGLARMAYESQAHKDKLQNQACSAYKGRHGTIARAARAGAHTDTRAERANRVRRTLQR